MKKLLLIVLLGPSLWAQDDIQSILDRNPFDPDRGKKDDQAEEEVVEELATPVDLPLLDGTIIVGGTKVALFSYVKDGIKFSARVVQKEGDSFYTLYEREERGKKKDDEEPKSSDLFLGKKNGRLGGTYTVAEIKIGSVELADRTGVPLPALEMRDGRKENRGGSRKISKPKKPKKPVASKPLGVADSKKDKDDKKNVNGKKGNTNKKPRFTKRNQPKLTPQGKTKRERLKSKM